MYLRSTLKFISNSLSIYNFMHAIKRVLYKILGLKRYLQIIRSVFFFSYYNSLLVNNKEYLVHYYVKKLINKGDTVIDIGANLGYYSRIFGKLTGKSGKVYAVEPVELFRKVLKGSIRNLPNVTIFPYALGLEDGKEISMGLPLTSKYLSHGRTKIVDSKPDDNYAYEFRAEMRHPNKLFSTIGKIDYIKCDIEGYEVVVIPAMEEIIKKHLPIIQIETDGENREKILRTLIPLGYEVFYVTSKGLEAYKKTHTGFSGDLILIHSSKI
jgi:FkbM family methyltransferase